MLYHEKQVAALCGVHCLNTLLQGPYFSEIDLAQIAHGLDELERQLVSDGGLGEASGNVAMDGMFSVQVLSRALQSWSLQAVSLQSEEARPFRETPTNANAFICNLHEHWFTLRQVAGGDWWNFNSLYPAPQPLSTFYLQAFLDTLRGEGWTIFVVVGQLPATQPGTLEQLPNSAGRWWSPEEARAVTEEAERARKRGRVNAALEGALARAEQQGARLALRTRGEAAAGTSAAAAAVNGEDDDDEDADLAAAIAASMQSHPATATAGAAQPQQLPQQQGGMQHPPEAGSYDLYGDEDDPELAMAIAASLADATGTTAAVDAAAGSAVECGSGGSEPAAGSGEKAAEPEAPLDPEPPEGEGVIEVAFRLPSGSRCGRRFALASPTAALFTYLASQMELSSAQIALSTTFPKKELERSATTTLADLGLTNRTLLVAEQRR